MSAIGSGQSGFTLLEAMVATAIVGTVGAAALAAAAPQMRTAVAAEEHILAASAAEYAYADLRVRAWAGEVPPGSEMALRLPADRDTARWVPYRATGVLRPMPDRLARATITVRWPAGERKLEGILLLERRP